MAKQPQKNTAPEFPDILLASRSPRRRDLLMQMGVRYEVTDVLVEEKPQPGEAPDDYVLRVAIDKAKAGWLLAGRTRELPVLGADTAGVLNGNILCKPSGKEDSLKMLAEMSGQTHQILTAVAIVEAERCETILVRSDVTFGKISQQQALAYWETGEPADKAGSYAIQGVGALFVSHLNGSYSGVVGLPVYETAALLSKFDISSLG